jgi:hypothetical protein
MLSGLTKCASFLALVPYASTTRFEAIALALFFIALHTSIASGGDWNAACSVGDYLAQAKHMLKF